MLKDIYSPLEIDDQWDQRAPSHEDKVEGGNPVAMDSAEAIPRENPSGGVAVMEQPPVPDMPVSADAGVQTQTTPEAPAEAEAAGTQTIETPSGGGSITNIGQLTVPAATEVAPTDSTGPETSTDQAPVSSMEDTSTEATGTETPEVASDNDAATMLDPQSQSEHDVPASPFDTANSEDDASSSNETAEATIEAQSAIPTTTVEPDEEHQASSGPVSEEGSSEDDAIRTIVEKPLTDDEREEVASDTDQMPVSPEPSTTDTEQSTADDEVSAEVSRGLEKVLKAIEAELEALENRKTRLKEALAKHEQDRADADAQATATQAQIDQVDAAISDLESKK